MVGERKRKMVKIKYCPPTYYAKLYMLYNDEELEDDEVDSYKIFDKDYDDIIDEIGE
jgi:hypothetical protein